MVYFVFFQLFLLKKNKSDFFSCRVGYFSNYRPPNSSDPF